MLSTRFRTRYMVAALAALFLAAGCGGSSKSSAPTTSRASSSTSAPAAPPIGVIAIGHSSLTGESSDPKHLGEPALENSWATGTSPAVNSVYQRLVAVNPETKGHVMNAARGGAPAADLSIQARVGLAEVPTPQLVIIETIDDDIRCDGTDGAHVPEFGQQVADALKLITDRSPRSVILIMSQPGRPADEVEKFGAVVKAAITGVGPCDFYNPAGALVPEHVQHLTDIIEKYEAEQARQCAKFSQCHDDGGAFTKFTGFFEDHSGDWNHLDTHGLSRLAATAWPVVQNVLNLPS